MVGSSTIFSVAEARQMLSLVKEDNWKATRFGLCVFFSMHMVFVLNLYFLKVQKKGKGRLLHVTVQSH